MGIVVRTGPGRRTRAAGAVVAAALLCAGTAGCGAEKSGGGKSGAKDPHMAPAAAVRAAAEKTEKLTSLSYRMSGSTPEDGRFEGEGAIAFKPPAMRMKTRSLDQGADASVEFRLTGGKLYLGGDAIKAGFDEESSSQLDGKSWLATDASALGKGGSGAAGRGGALANRADKNPAEESAFLSDADNVRRVGDETIDGARTTHYRGTVTLAQMRASLEDEDAATRKRREKSLRQYEELGVDRLAMDMWIDKDSHTKRFRTRGKGDSGPLDITITFMDINKPVTVQAPPTSDTFDLADLTRGLEG
ncbi:hypothetical protein [Streptomyces sp. RTd22]|uniref:hypothetical protein n=1 Tax=Streptomyces sp. RTd22 TaxID=1841249 RepID=UPI0007C51B96|nr:hypothetical protein [Streptomyces sp. RTd22]